MMTLTDFVPLAARSDKYFLMATVDIPAGEPSELNAELECFDFHNQLTGCEDGVFMVRVNGDSMEDEIFHGDWLIVNRNLQAKTGDKVVFCINGSYTIKTYAPCKNGLRLIASNDKYPTRFISSKEDCEIFGVITHVIRQLKKI